MKIGNATKLTEKYACCPRCGNDKCGNGQGRFIVEENVFIRTCKCGNKVVAVENNQGKIIIELP